ncbi:ankyrin repeat domain-containing protein [Dyadobacter pollutisoli]|uniref:Ankyrin repeat domain-containing protein n=1 Tax=Dyadobacter pollutisoli TaxID=2910158 RepID=A0A9E8SKK5_9BACT|nr:ankyrin repeat domain-containing protein [Dyadobacter pollutisoli]WAC12585.1 ankyrin repeat domain-containing protein [Dyadobacter pollutisoli]
MKQPEGLSKNEPLLWSPGTGTEVWEMFIAAQNGDIDTIKKLLEKDSGLIRGAFDYRTPISFAVQENQLETVAYLLQKGANPIESGTNDTLLQIAKDRGYPEMQALLEKVLNKPHDSAAGEEMGKAIRSRDVNAVRKLLESNVENLNAVDDRGNQPIHWAVMTRNPEMIDLVLSFGADIDKKRPDGARPIQLTNGDYHYRGWRDVPDDVTLKPNDIYLHLKSRGAYVNMCVACLRGEEARVRELLNEDPASANRLSEYGGYYPGAGAPLKNAAMAGHIHIVKLLLENGADPNLPEEGIAPLGHALHSAVVYGQNEIVKLLLAHGAHPNVPVESSADTLTAAMSRNDQELVDLLCSHGAARSVEILAYYGDLRTAAAVFNANPDLANDVVALENAAGEGQDNFVRLMLRYYPDLPKRAAVGVASQGNADPIKSMETAELLFEHGMDPNFSNWLGIRPLHRFAERDDLISAKLFVEKGAELDVVDDQICATPLGWAAKSGRIELVRFLLEKGADPTIPADKPWALPIEWARRRGHSEIVTVLGSQ